MSSTQPINIPKHDIKAKNHLDGRYIYTYINDSIPDYPSTPDDNNQWEKKLIQRINSYTFSNSNNLNNM